MQRNNSGIVMLVALGVASASASASIIPITNAGFESVNRVTPAGALDIPDGAFVRLDGSSASSPTATGNWTPSASTGTYSIPGWTATNGGVASVQDDPSTSFFNSGFVSGENVAMINKNASNAGSNQNQTTSLTNTLASSLLSNATYTLTVKVADRKSVAFAGYTIELLAGGTSIKSVSSSDLGAWTPTSDGDFSTITLTYTSPGSGSIIGQALGIRLGTNAPGNQAFLRQTAFEDVALVVPEPSAIAALGLVGTLLGRRSRRRRD